jgi:hypothetical protein
MKKTSADFYDQIAKGQIFPFQLPFKAIKIKLLHQTANMNILKCICKLFFATKQIEKTYRQY